MSNTSYSPMMNYQNVNSNIPNMNNYTNNFNESENLTSKYTKYKNALLDNNTNNDIQSNNLNMSMTTPTNYLFSITPSSKDPEDISTLKKAYDDRIISLYNNLRVVISKLQTDDLLTTMRNDNTNISGNEEFITSRIKEILDEEFYSEKEKTISKLTQENAALRTQLNSSIVNNDSVNSEYLTKIKNMNVEQDMKIKQLEKIVNDQNNHVNELLQENLSTKKLYDTLNEEYNTLKAQMSSYIDNSEFNANDLDDAKTEIQRLNKVISVIEIDLASSEQLVKEKADKIDTMTKEMTSLQSQIFDFNLKLKKYVDENNSKQKLIDHYEKERKDILTKYSTYQNEIEKSQQDKLNQYAKTISIYEKSLEDEKAKNDYLKEKYNQMYNEMQNNMKMISSEWDKKLKKVQNNYESIITDIETKQKYDIDTMKTKYEIESQKNIEEIAKLKTIVDNYKNIDHDYIKISNHENILNEKIKEIKNIYEKEMKEQKDKIENVFSMKLQKLNEEKKKENEYVNESMKEKLETSEKENSELKKGYERYKIENDNLKDNVDKLNQIIEEKNKMVKTLKEKNTITEVNGNKLNSHLTIALKENEELNNEIKKIKQQVNDMSHIVDKVEQYKNEIIRYQVENEKLKKNIQDKESILNVNETKLKNTNNELMKKEKELILLKQEKEQLSSNVFTLQYEHKSKKDLLIKIFNTKIQLLRNQLVTLEDYYKNEIVKIQKETKQQFNLLIDKIQTNSLCNNTIISKLKSQNKSLNEQIETYKNHNDLLLSKTKETSSQLESSTNKKNEKIKQLQQALNSLLEYINKIKNNYGREFIQLKYDIDNLNKLHQNEISLKEKECNTKIESIYSELQETSSSKETLQTELENKVNELNEFKDNYTKLKNVYESKINTLNTKIETNEEILNETNNTLSIKEEQINHLNNLILDVKNQNKSLQNQIELKNDEMFQFKKQCDKMIANKDNKISQLQTIVNQSISSFNKGANNIKIAKQLDDEVKELIRTAKRNSLNDSLNEIKISSINNIQNK